MTYQRPSSRLGLQPLLLACGVLAWLGVVAPVVVQDSMRCQAPLSWWITVALYQVFYLAQHRANTSGRARLARGAFLAMIVLSLAAVGVYSADGLTPLLFVINMATLGFVFSRAWVVPTLVFFVVILIVILPVQGLGMDWTISYIALLSFAALMVEIAVRETQARAIALETTTELEAMNRQLARTNAELAAAQSRLARQRVDEERLRIARDLHDAIGHQLTVLSLNLEVASHLTQGRAAAHVDKSRDLTKEILGSIRTVVSTMRDPGLHLAAELSKLTEGVAASGLDIEVQLGDGLQGLPPGVTEVLVRIAQEALTNVTKHADATRVRLAVHQDDGWVVESIQDNGRGVAHVAVGNGIAGMQERVQALGGTVRWTTGPSQGFRLEVRMPVRLEEIV